MLRKMDIRKHLASRPEWLNSWTDIARDVVVLMNKGHLEDAQDKLDSFPVHTLPQVAQERVKKVQSEMVQLQIKKRGKTNDGKARVRTCLQQIQ